MPIAADTIFDTDANLRKPMSMPDARKVILRGLLLARIVSSASQAVKDDSAFRSIGAASRKAAEDLEREIKGGFLGSIAIDHDEVSFLLESFHEIKENAAISLALCDLVYEDVLPSGDGSQVKKEQWKTNIPGLYVGDKVRMDYKSHTFHGVLASNGHISVGGLDYSSLSKAAIALADSVQTDAKCPSINGRLYWKAFVNGAWTSICNIDKS